MTFEESEALRKQQKRDNEEALGLYQTASEARILAAKLEAEDRRDRVVHLVTLACTLVILAAVIG